MAATLTNDEPAALRIAPDTGEADEDVNDELAVTGHCRFGDPRKENCDMMCRPLRAVIVERRYAFILSYRDICVVFRFHQVTRWNKYEHYLSFLGIVSLAINRVGR